MAILILEPTSDGHRFHYLLWSARAYLSQGRKVVIGVHSGDIEHTFISQLQSEYPHHVELINLDYRRRLQGFPLREIHLWRWFRNIYKQIPATDIEEIFVPFLDHFLYAIPLLGSPFGTIKFSGIIMTQSFHHREFNIIRPVRLKDLVEKRLFASSQKNANLTRLLSIDPYLKESLYSTDKVAYVPDPHDTPFIVDQAEARERLQLDADKNYILVFGSLTARKGIASLLESINSHNVDANVLLIGRHDKEIMNLLDQAPARKLLEDGKLLSINRFIAPEQETLWYCAADAVWMGYRDHYGSSGNLIKAAMAGKPVIACQEGLIGKQTHDHELGLTCIASSVDDIADTIAKLPEFAHNRNKHIGEAFAREHDVSSFYQVVAGESG